MTPQFTASAYVWIEDEVIRHSVHEKLKSLGWCTYLHTAEETDDYLFISGKRGKIFTSSAGGSNIFIDCGTNTYLFLELAQMRSDTDKGQWFIEDKIRTDGIGGQIAGCEPIRKIGERMVKYERDDKGVTNHINECNNNGGRCFIRRATPSQVYEHLKRR